jgi:hypothetical protein
MLRENKGDRSIAIPYANTCKTFDFNITERQQGEAG